jgi:predicted GIY-YIG superfamily endonuclease
MKKIYLYHLKQNNDVKYVGLTINIRNRMLCHNIEKPKHTFLIKNYYYNAKQAALNEIKDIKKYNTYENGWNKSKGGENYFMGFVDRKGIGGVSKGFIPWNKGKKKCFSDETIKRFSKIRKGKIHSSKLNEKIVKEIRKLYNKKPKVNFEVNKIMKNGKKMSYVQAFSKTYNKNYNITVENLKKIILKRSWLNVN